MYLGGVTVRELLVEHEHVGNSVFLIGDLAGGVGDEDPVEPLPCLHTGLTCGEANPTVQGRGPLW